MGRAVDLADVAVELVASEGPIATGVAHVLDRLPPASSPVEVVIRHVPDGPVVPAHRADLELERVAVWIDGDEVHLRDATGATARLSSRSAEIGGGGERAANGFHALFLFALTHLLAHHDRYVLHGAAVAGPGGAVVALGGSGTGKSTLAVAALEAGWGLLADDMVVIRRTDCGLEVTGVPRPVTVPADMVGSLSAQPVGGARPRAFVATELARGWFPVAATVALGHDPSPDGSVRAMDAHATFQLCLGSFVSTMNPPLLRRFLPVAAALSRLPGWELRHGSDPRIRRPVAARLLATAAGLEP